MEVELLVIQVKNGVPHQLNRCCVTERAYKALKQIYGEELRLSGDCYDGPSPACRDEALLRGDRERHSKVCVFESRRQHDWQTVGVAHFRPIHGFRNQQEKDSWVLGMAEGFFVPPHDWNSAQLVPLITNDYMVLLGHEDVRLETVPFSGQWYASGSCTAAALYMALLSTCVGSRGLSHVCGPFTLSCLVRIVGHDPQIPDSLRKCLLVEKDGVPVDQWAYHEHKMGLHDGHDCRRWRDIDTRDFFTIFGIPFDAIGYLLDKVSEAIGSARTRCSRYQRASSDADRQEFASVLASFISSRIPVLLRTDPEVLNEKRCVQPEPPVDYLHTILVVGGRDLLSHNAASAILYHDPAEGPFRSAGLNTVFQAARTRLNESKSPGCRGDYFIEMAAVVPYGVSFAPQVVWRSYREFVEDVERKSHGEDRAQFAATYPTDVCWRARLLDTNDVQKAYLGDGLCNDLEIVLPDSPMAMCLELYGRGSEAAKGIEAVALFRAVDSRDAHGHSIDPISYGSPVGLIRRLSPDQVALIPRKGKGRILAGRGLVSKGIDEVRS